MGPRAGLDRCGKSRSPPGFDSRTVQLVASRYTDYATRPTEYKRESRKSRGKETLPPQSTDRVNIPYGNLYEV